MESPSTKIAVLASGGVDSDVLIGEFLRRDANVFPVYIRCGYRWEKAELFWLKKFLRSLPRDLGRRARPLAVLEMPARDLDRRSWAVTGRNVPGDRSKDDAVFLPGRNLLLLAKAATFCALRHIPLLAIGSLSGNPFSDASPAFFSKMGRAASEALGVSVKIIAPFARLKKTNVLRKGRGLPLHLSFSCLSPRGMQACGDCNKCAERRKVL